MYSSDALVETEAEDPSPRNFEPEDLERQISMKVLHKQKEDALERPSYFARWFQLVPPDKTIREDEYFWHTGQALDADFWTDDEKLDNYLGLNDTPRQPLWDEPEEISAAKGEEVFSPPKLSLNFSEDDTESISSYGSDVEKLVADDDLDQRSSSESSWELDTISDVSEFEFAAPSFRKEISDWSEMPPILPRLPVNDVSVKAKPLTRELSDWSKMPNLLPPLNSQVAPELDTLDVPVMSRFTSDPSEWVAMPSNMVPKAVPQASWDSTISAEIDQPTPMWLRNEELSRYPIPAEPIMVRQDLGLPNSREMEFLSSVEVAQPSGVAAPTMYGNGGYAPVFPTAPQAAIAPLLVNPTPFNPHALVQYPCYPALTNAVDNNMMVVARQPPQQIPPHQMQYSVFAYGGEYNIAVSHNPSAAFVYPSKTATEVVLHLVFPALYHHIPTGSICSGFANSYAIVDAASFPTAETYFPTSTTNFASRQACDVVQVN